MVVCELLSYVSFYRDRVSMDSLRKVLIGFYSAVEINTAKKLLVGTFATDLTDCPLKAERRKSTSRGVNEAEVEDVVGIFDHLDQRSSLLKATFVAANLERLPKYGPKEINICTIAGNQSELGISIASLANRVDELATHCSSPQLPSFTDFKTDITNTVHQGFDSLQAKITHLATVCSQLVDGVNSQQGAAISGSSTASSGTTSASTGSIDRSRNIVIFGVDDTRDRQSWHDKVLEALHIAAGRDVMIDDAVRIGKMSAGKKRPVLVKLQSVWDRRTVLSG